MQNFNDVIISLPLQLYINNINFSMQFKKKMYFGNSFHYVTQHQIHSNIIINKENLFCYQWHEIKETNSSFFYHVTCIYCMYVSIIHFNLFYGLWIIIIQFLYCCIKGLRVHILYILYIESNNFVNCNIIFIFSFFFFIYLNLNINCKILGCYVYDNSNSNQSLFGFILGIK